MRLPITQKSVLAILGERGAMKPAELALTLGWGKDGLPKIEETLGRLRARGKIEDIESPKRR